MMSNVAPSRSAGARSLPSRVPRDINRASGPRVLDPHGLGNHIDRLYRAAWGLCGSRQDAEDLVQETFLNVLKRPRLLGDGDEISYLLRALKNTHANRYRAASRRPSTCQLHEDQAPSRHTDGDITAHEIMQAVASAPGKYRDAVVAVDLLGLSYREAARALHTREATITTRLHRGRQHVAHQLIGTTTSAAQTPAASSAAQTPAEASAA